MTHCIPSATSSHAALLGPGLSSTASAAPLITAATLADLRTHWPTLSALVHARQRPDASQHAQALIALRAYPPARSKFLTALRNTLLRDFEANEKPQLVHLLSRATGVERLIKGLAVLRDYQHAWLEALDAPDEVRHEFRVGFHAQLVGMMDPGLEKYLARYVLVTAGGTYAVPISDADANQVRQELGLPLLDPARQHQLPTSTIPNANLTLLHSLQIFPLVLPSMLASAKDHIHTLIASSPPSTASLLSAPLTPPILDAIHTSVYPRLAHALCPVHVPPTALYRDLLHTAALEILRVRGKHMPRVIPAGVDACLGAVADVRMCMRIGYKVTRQLVVDPTRAWMRDKVFVASKPTHDILRVFISAIQVFRAIEAGVASAGGQPMFHDLVEEMKVYLRGRDAVKDLVALVFPMEGAGGAVAEEELLEGQEIRMEEEESRYLVVVDEAIKPWTPEDEAGEWVDRPRVPAAATIPQGIPRDTLSILMNIYPAKDVFATTYAARLADLLQSDRDTDLDNLWRVVTRLARRISAKDMGACLAMVRDAIESREVNASVRHPVVHPLVISAEVWPDEWSREAMADDEVDRLHPELMRLAKDFTQQFTARTPLHTLAMYPTTGTVTLALDFDDDAPTLPPFTVESSPDQASLLMHLSNEDEWTRDALTDAMHLPAKAVRALVYFWIRRGLVEHVPNKPGVYRAVRERPATAGGGQGVGAHTRASSAGGGTAVDDWGVADTSLGEGGVDVDGASAGSADVFEGVTTAMVDNWVGFAKVAVGKADVIRDIHANMSRFYPENSRPNLAQMVAVLDMLVDKGVVEKVEDAKVEGGSRYFMWTAKVPGTPQ